MINAYSPVDTVRCINRGITPEDMSENKVFKNAKWIVICKVAQSLLQLVIGMLSARYLGPANYGLINYAKSVVAFVVPLTQLGLNATLVRELIDTPDREGEIMGTSLVMGLMSSFWCMALVVGFVFVANAGELETLIVCLLYSLSLFFQIIELTQYWFHSKLQSKYPSLAMLAAYIVVSAYKIYLLVSGKNIYWFAVVHSIEYGLTGIALLIIYHKCGGQKLSASVSMAKRLLSRSRYYILSSLMVTVFQNTDHVMLKTMAGDVENGFYSAAITCAGVCQFVYAAIIDSARPAILARKKANKSDYEITISKLYCIITYLALAQGVGFSLFAELIVRILYGTAYMKTVPVLQILVWYIAFSQMGRIRNIWILAEEKQSFLWKINLAGVVVNILINAMLIPVWGACGAALASLLTQFFSNFVLGFLYSPLRENNRMLLKGLSPKLLLRVIRKRDFLSE